MKKLRRDPTVLATLLTLLLSVAFPACRKPDALDASLIGNEKQFFTLPPGTSAAGRQLASSLQLLQEKDGFVASYARKAGYPVWNHIAEPSRRAAVSRSAEDRVELLLCSDGSIG